MNVPLGRSGWYFCDWDDDPPTAEYREFHGSETSALQWLGQFRQDSAAMNDLHQLWAKTSSELLTDEEVLRQVSWWLRIGKVKARQPLTPIMGGGSVPSIEAPAPPPRRREEAPAPTKEEETLDADLVAIASVLRGAAENGTPLCEECARAAAAREA